MATNDAPLNVAASRGLSLALGQAEINWASRLAKVGSGTPDASFNPETDITYVGAFRIPYFSNGTTSTTIKDYIGFKPAEVGGRNGPNGSLFLGGDGAGGGGWLGEVQIPDFSSTASETDYTQLPAATVLQNFVQVFANAPTPDSGSASPVTIPAGLRFVGDTLYMQCHAFYEANADNAANILIINDAKDLVNSSYQGFLSHDAGFRDFKYNAVLPAEWQASFGGATDLVGVWASHSIIGRSIYGPGLYGWSPADIQPADTSVSMTRHAYYPGSNPVEGWSYNGEELLHFYEDQLVITRGTLNDYLAQDPANRITEPSTLGLPNESLHPSSGHDTNIACAFVPPGTDTLVFIGRAEGHRFGSLYKETYWEGGAGPGGWHQTKRDDVDNFFWTMNLNDVVNAVNDYDPGLIQYGIFDNNRWKGTGSVDDGLISSGAFDPISGRLYLCHVGIPWSEFEDQKILSVYQVGGGV